MEPTDQLTTAPTLIAEVTTPARPASPIRTILLHVQNDSSLETRLQVGLSLARATRAHLKCLHVTPIEAYVTMDSFGGLFVMDKLMKEIDEQEEQLGSTLKSRLRVEDVTWDYQQITANVVTEIIRCAALVDLVVTGRRAHVDAARRGLELSILGDILSSVRTPLLIPGDTGAEFDPFGTVVIAWNGSYEAANAVRNAIGMLKLAANVRVVRVTEGRDEQFPPTILLEYLSRHDIHVELDSLARDSEQVADSITKYAHTAGAGTVVMGAYGHSRAGEFLFGGVTRALLKNCPVALVMAH